MRAVVLLVVVAAVAVALWYAWQSAWEDRTAGILAPYASAPLPAPGAPVDSVLADVGADLFRKHCSACHTIHGGDKIGPDLAGVTERRDYAWIRGMILSPDSMTAADPAAQALKEELAVQMVTPRYFEGVHALSVLEFLRRVDQRSGG
jgi:cytochrome c2